MTDKDKYLRFDKEIITEPLPIRIFASRSIHDRKKWTPIGMDREEWLEEVTEEERFEIANCIWTLSSMGTYGPYFHEAEYVRIDALPDEVRDVIRNITQRYGAGKHAPMPKPFFPPKVGS